jgi:hypothetical protein
VECQTPIEYDYLELEQQHREIEPTQEEFQDDRCLFYISQRHVRSYHGLEGQIAWEVASGNVCIQYGLIDGEGGPLVVSDVVDLVSHGNIVVDYHTVVTGCSSPGQCTTPLGVARGSHIACTG